MSLLPYGASCTATISTSPHSTTLTHSDTHDITLQRANEATRSRVVVQVAALRTTTITSSVRWLGFVQALWSPYTVQSPLLVPRSFLRPTDVHVQPLVSPPRELPYAPVTTPRPGYDATARSPDISLVVPCAASALHTAADLTNAGRFRHAAHQLCEALHWPYSSGLSSLG